MKLVYLLSQAWIRFQFMTHLVQMLIRCLGQSEKCGRRCFGGNKGEMWITPCMSLNHLITYIFSASYATRVVWWFNVQFKLFLRCRFVLWKAMLTLNMVRKSHDLNVKNMKVIQEGYICHQFHSHHLAFSFSTQNPSHRFRLWFMLLVEIGRCIKF